MKREPEWWAIARELRANGLSLREIAKLTDRDVKAVHMALDPDKRTKRYAYWRQWNCAHKARRAAMSNS